MKIASLFLVVFMAIGDDVRQQNLINDYNDILRNNNPTNDVVIININQPT